ncbi:MAG: YchJ family protein [Acidiferrobacterales bacterium]
MSKRNKTNLCFCGSGLTYTDCCGRYIDESVIVPTPEHLMRSRYSAYCLGDEAYLLKTWHSSTRPASLDLNNNPVKWIGLEIIDAPEVLGDSGSVEFVARFKQNGRAGKLHENSRFLREQDRWLYVDGVRKR